MVTYDQWFVMLFATADMVETTREPELEVEPGDVTKSLQSVIQLEMVGE